MKNMEERIIKRINSEIGDDVKNLHKASSLVHSYTQQFKDIEGKLNLEDNNYSSTIKSALLKEKKTRDVIDFEVEKIQQFERKLSEKLQECDTVITNVNPNLQKIDQLEQLIAYLKIVQEIQDINESLQTAITGKDETRIVELYLLLCREWHSSNSVIGRLEDLDAYNLKSYAIKSASAWYDIIKDKLSNDFETTLKHIKWPPQQGQLMENFLPSKESLTKISLLAEYLFLIKPPGEEPDRLVMITPSIVVPRISLPTQLLLKPFRQRFQYHFSGSRQTNRLDKPEWYFTQILNWAKENHLFVGKNFQSSAVKAGLENFNVRLEFIRGLVQFTIEKLAYDIEEINRDDSLFAHLIDETLAFETELRETLGYLGSFPSAITVITQPQYLLRWIQIEEQFCTDKIDLVLQGEYPWEFIDPNNMEELKIPKCADQFVRLLDAIKDRYSSLTQPGHQLQFLNLQLELIDNFRRRLVQLHASGTVETTKILNAINYITSVLSEWGENVHYLHLHAALIGPSATEINSVFDESVQELNHWQGKLIKELTSKIVDEIKAKSMLYRHDNNWSKMLEQSADEPLLLSSTAGEMFQVMMSTLHNLEKDLSLNLFTVSIRLISKQLDDFFIDSLIMNTKFSTGGAKQFHFDMIRNLFPLFGQYIRRPDLLFKRIHDCCLLLALPRGNALLLYQSLTENVSIEENFKTLKEIGVINLKPGICKNILERRKDIRVC